MTRPAWKHALVAAAILALAAAGLMPLVGVPALAPPLKASLSRALGRPVELESVRCTLLPRPALLASNLVIAEDPGFGLEPFAYADEIRASLSVRALLGGSLALSEIRLDGASLNVARLAQAGFNVAAFLRKTMSPAAGAGRIPRLSLRRSRINFRNGPLKSAYYLNDVDLDVDPPQAPGGELRWRYEASPARTDRAEQGFGRFTGAGRWIPGNGGGRFAVDVGLERSAVPELTVLLTGRDLGLQGRFTTRAFLDGPFNALELRGHIEMEELERPAFFGLRSRNIQLPFHGILDLDLQTIRLETAEPRPDRPAAPLEFRFQGSGLLAAPQWLAEVAFRNLPAPALLDVCQRLGLAAPPGLAAEGSVSGSARFASGAPASGRLEASSLSLRFGEAPPVAASEAVLRLEGGLLALDGARILTPKQAEATVKGAWDLASHRLSFEVATGGMEIAEINGALAALPALGPPPVLRACTGGLWRGRLAMSVDFVGAARPGAPAWTGRAAVSGARCLPAEMPAPLLLDKAMLELSGSGWRLLAGEARFAGAAVTVSARSDPASQPPVQVSIEAARLQAGDVEALLRIAQPPPRSLLDRTLRRRAAMPAWLRRLYVRGSLKAGVLALGKQEFEDLETPFVWRGPHLQFDGLRARWNGAAVQGSASAALWREDAVYRVRAVVTDLATPAGTIDAELEASTPTLGAGLERKARGWAEAGSPLLRLPGGSSLRHMQVSLDYDGARNRGPWRLAAVGFWLDGHFWSGRGEAAAGGAARVDFSSPEARWEGQLWPPALAPAPR